MFLSVTKIHAAEAYSEISAEVKSVMTTESGTVLIFLTSNIHECSHPNRVAIRVDNSDYKNRAVSIALTAKTTGTKIKLFMKGGCQEWGQ